MAKMTKKQIEAQRLAAAMAEKAARKAQSIAEAEARYQEALARQRAYEESEQTRKAALSIEELAAEEAATQARWNRDHQIAIETARLRSQPAESHPFVQFHEGSYEEAE